MENKVHLILHAKGGEMIIILYTYAKEGEIRPMTVRN
jgi:hypothetical protein